MVLVEDESDASDPDLAEIRRWAEQVLAAEGYPPTAELSVILVTDEAMARLHQAALGQEGPTDVLSFPVDRLAPGRPPLSAEGPPVVVGDVYLAPRYIDAQARSLDLDGRDELALMVTHGVLHCLGYDHGTEIEAETMESRERELLAAVGRTRR